LVCEIIALASFVLLQRWLQSLPDRGLALSKTLGLVLVAWLIWFAASVGLLSYNRAGLLVIVGPLVLIAVAVVWWQRDHWARLWHQYRWMWLTTQGIFWVAFALFVLIRAANPDLWHPARGGEKPMDLAFLTAVVRSPSFPPYDPWFAGGMLNYYYFGFVMVGVLVHLTGIAPSTAYNLAVPLLFALTAVGVWGVALALQGWRGQTAAPRWRDWWQRIRVANQRKVVGALLAALLVTVAGNWAQALWLMPGSARDGQSCEVGDSYAAVAGCFGRPEWAFWDATRVVSIKTGDGVINEFPFFTFLFADLHAHMIGLPLLVAALGRHDCLDAATQECATLAGLVGATRRFGGQPRTLEWGSLCHQHLGLPDHAWFGTGDAVVVGVARSPDEPAVAHGLRSFAGRWCVVGERDAGELAVYPGVR